MLFRSSILFEKIQNKLYREGDIIPTEAELQETYQISRSTVRQAIAELVQEGWLDRRTSKGTFVTYPKSGISHIHPFEPFYQQVKQLGKTSKTELIHLSIIDLDNTYRLDSQLHDYRKIAPLVSVIAVDRKSVV